MFIIELQFTIIITHFNYLGKENRAIKIQGNPHYF